MWVIGWIWREDKGAATIGDVSCEDVRSFGCLADALRQRAKLATASGTVTERGLARVSGVSQPHVHHWLAGKRRLSLDSLDAILEALRVRVNEL